ncbi:MAG: sugar nucleotide-binding protein, partial [Saprospiraceae bacterium]
MEKIKKVLILGSTGMLGHQVQLRLADKKEYEIIDLSYRTKFTEKTIICNITDKPAFSKIIQDLSPDIIVNCIGVLIKGSTTNPANAIYINSYFPHFLRQIGEENNAKVIHISTDCVFSGKKGAYTLDDFKDGEDIYAKSKSLGEIIHDDHLTLRTSIIGP